MICHKLSVWKFLPLVNNIYLNWVLFIYYTYKIVFKDALTKLHCSIVKLLDKYKLVCLLFIKSAVIFVFFFKYSLRLVDVEPWIIIIVLFAKIAQVFIFLVDIRHSKDLSTLPWGTPIYSTSRLFFILIFYYGLYIYRSNMSLILHFILILHN